MMANKMMKKGFADMENAMKMYQAGKLTVNSATVDGKGNTHRFVGDLNDNGLTQEEKQAKAALNN
jgi:hypothetical protein